MFGHGDYLEIVPAITWSWGIVSDHDDFGDGGFTPRRTVWDPRPCPPPAAPARARRPRYFGTDHSAS